MFVNITIEQIVTVTSKIELISLRDAINTRLIASTQLDEHEKGLVADGDMVAAIINYRDRNGGSLAECRDAISGFIAQLARPPRSYDQV